MNLYMTKHASIRCQQRGLCEKDVDLILDNAVAVDRDGYLLRRKDAQKAIQKRKDEIQRLEHLAGVKVVMEEGRVITVMRTSRKNQKNILNR